MVGKSKPSEEQMSFWEPESDWEPPNELPDLSREQEVAIDTETRDNSLSKNYGPGFYKKDGHIAGISMAWRNESIYVPLQHRATRNFDKGVVKSWLKDVTSNEHIRFVFHNFQYDWGWLEAEFDLRPPAKIDDTMAMASMVNENLPSFTLDDLCEWQGLPGKDERILKEICACRGIAEKDIKKRLWTLEGKFIGPYAEQDAASTLELAARLRPLLDAEELNEAYEIERQLLPLTLKMKQRGIRVDVSRALQLQQEVKKARNEILDQLTHSLGNRVTVKEIRANRWVKDQFDAYGIQYPRTAPTEHYPDGQASFEKSYMANHQHWLPRAVHKAKHLTDLADKFLQGYICEYSHNGRVHPTVNQFRSEGGGARSHRFSYADPPLQQMPSRDDDWAPLIRSCFLPEDGELWAAPDFNQQEYRLIVHVAEIIKSPRAVLAGDRYRKDPSTDFHQYVVDMTKLHRRRAKDVNFAKAFGAGVPKFALMIGVSQEEAANIYKQYDEELPFVSDAAFRYARSAASRGYIKMIDGARGHFNLWEPGYRDFAKEKGYKTYDSSIDTTPCSEAEADRRYNDRHHPWYHEKMKRAFTHKAFNRMIQGSAARQTKKAMVDIYQAGYQPLIQMHDELGCSFANEKDGIAVQQFMMNAVKLTVPVYVDLEWGVNWGEAAKNKSTGYMATFAEALSRRK